MEPAVPGALGEKPAPPAVAMTIATQSVLVFTISIGMVDFFRRPFFRGKSIFAAGPFTEVDQLAAFTAERTVRVGGVFGFFFAGGTFHWRRLRSNDLPDQIVFEAFGDFDIVELAGCHWFIAGVVDQDMSIDFRSLRLYPALKQQIRFIGRAVQ